MKNEDANNNPKIESFLSKQGRKIIIMSETSFTSEERSYIDLLITNRPSFHQLTQMLELGMRGHDLTICVMLTLTDNKLKPKVLKKRQYKSFRKDFFLQDIKNSLSNVGILITSKMQIKKTDRHVPVKIPVKSLWKYKTTHH